MKLADLTLNINDICSKIFLPLCLTVEESIVTTYDLNIIFILSHINTLQNELKCHRANLNNNSIINLSALMS